MKLKTLAGAYPALTKLASQDMPTSVLYRFSKVLEALEPDIRFFMNQRGKLFEKYGSVEDGQYVVSEENAQKFADELDELEDIEAEIDCDKLGLPLVIPISTDVKISYVDLCFLEGILKLEEKEE